MSYRVKAGGFEGPFDLLLYLVARQKVDIGSISLSQVVDQYLSYVDRMQELDLEVASDFLLVASALLEIKASSLVFDGGDDFEDDIEDLSPAAARDVLVARLLEYKKFKNAASFLESRYEDELRVHYRSFGPGEAFSNSKPDYLEGVSLGELGLLAAAAMTRREEFLLESEHIAAKPVPVEAYVRSISTALSVRKRAMFSELVPDESPLPVKVATFLALLELYKRCAVRIEQCGLFGEIAVELSADREKGLAR